MSVVVMSNHATRPAPTSGLGPLAGLSCSVVKAASRATSASAAMRMMFSSVRERTDDDVVPARDARRKFPGVRGSVLQVQLLELRRRRAVGADVIDGRARRREREVL